MPSKNDQTSSINNKINKTAHTSDLNQDATDDFDYLLSIQQYIFEQPLDKTALIYDDQFISFTELGKNVVKVISALERLKLVKGSVVAIHLPKGPEYIYSVLACALKGIIWLPIDVDSPASRHEYLLANSQVDLVLSNRMIDDYPTFLIQDILLQESSAVAECEYSINREAAYYLYTSGSTGTPKCVVLNNQATANVIQQTVENWQMNADDVLISVTPFHHDMSVFDIFASMALGATLVLPTPNQSKNAVAWAALLERYQVTIWVSVPAIVDMLCSVAKATQLKTLRLIAQGGDYIKPHLIQSLKQKLPNARLISLGGPTETTIWSIWHEIETTDQDVIPYGKALKHNQYFILDEHLQPCPTGEIGRMYMTGLNISNGYLLDGNLSQKDFVQIKVADTLQTAFQMSDLGYFTEDGNIIFAGREEGYLKIKGVRISAAEVEMALVKYTLLQENVVVCCMHPQTEQHELVAIYTLPNRQDSIDIHTLKDDLKRYLPLSHIPTKWLHVDKIPLTQNAKIDRKLLKKIAQEQLYQSAQTQLKNIKNVEDIADSVLAIFRESLLEQDSSSSNIFYQTEILALGIRAKQLKVIAQKISEKFDTSIDFYTLASCKTVQEIANHVQAKLIR